jgi:hypothetical protein
MHFPPNGMAVICAVTFPASSSTYSAEHEVSIEITVLICRRDRVSVQATGCLYRPQSVCTGYRMSVQATECLYRLQSSDRLFFFC